MKEIRIVFAGGGTGGHLYPALAIAQGLRKPLAPANCQIDFIGTRRGLEYRMRDTLEYPLHLIPGRGVRRALDWRNALVPFAALGALWSSWRLLRSLRPHLVVGTGGYVSGPVALVAKLRGTLTVIQEQNSSPGVTTRLLAPWMDRVYLGFAESREKLSRRARVCVTGNPVREEIGRATQASARAHFGLDPAKTTILILGGSLGAISVNRAVLRHLDTLSESVQLLWQTGERDYDTTRAIVGERRNCHIVPFIPRMELAWAAADVAVCRAGALTIAELLVTRTPAVLIPYPHATDDHQTANALSIERMGAGIHLADHDLAQHNPLAQALSLTQGPTRAAMICAMDKWNNSVAPGATARIADDIVTLFHERGVIS